MSRFALRLKGVIKRYGKTRALDGLTLDVPSGALMGLVGPNGAGKTTTFGVVSGAVRADAGQVDVLGQGAFDPVRHAGRLTVLPQDCALNPSSSARQILSFHARLQGLTLQAATREADRVLDLVHLADRSGARVGQLSHGMKRRLAVAQALLGDPELVLLDEPTGGLDPHLVVAMREILSAQRGLRTVVVSSHILADLEATCDHVAFMEDGRCTRSGPVAEVTRRGALVRVQLAEPMALAAFGLFSPERARLGRNAYWILVAHFSLATLGACGMVVTGSESVVPILVMACLIVGGSAVMALAFAWRWSGARRDRIEADGPGSEPGPGPERFALYAGALLMWPVGLIGAFVYAEPHNVRAGTVAARLSMLQCFGIALAVCVGLPILAALYAP